MKRVIQAAKEQARGVFWVIGDQLLAFPFFEEYSGVGIAKSLNTFNHKRLWPEVCPSQYRKRPYSYYPRGRVDFNNKGKPIVYMNPNISEEWLADIKIEFGLREYPQVRYDHSEHYKCYLDEGWKPDK